MADVYSKIVLKASGGDQVAQEIRKAKRAFDETAESSKKISPVSGGVSSDPFTRATSGGVPTTSEVSSRQRASREALERGEQRERESRQQGGGTTLRTGSGASLVGQGGAITQQLAAGRYESAAAGGLMSGGGLAMSAGALALGGGLLAGGALLKGVGALSDTESGRIEQIYSAGISQRLGTDYETSRNFAISLARTGFTKEQSMEYLSALSHSGARLTPGGTAAFTNTAEAALSLGVPLQTAASLVGSSTQMNVGVGMGLFGRAAGGFGREHTSTYIDALIAEQNRRMQSGLLFEESSTDTFIREQKTLAGYREIGGLTQVGAAALYAQSSARAAASTNLQSPEDILALTAVRRQNPEMSITEAMIAMESDPDMVNSAMYQRIASASTDTDVQRMMARKYLGGSMSQAEGWLRTQEGMAEGELATTLSTAQVRKYGVEDASAREVIALENAQVFQGAEEALSNALRGVRRLFLGDNIVLDAREIRFGEILRGATTRRDDVVIPENVEVLSGGISERDRGTYRFVTLQERLTSDAEREAYRKFDDLTTTQYAPYYSPEDTDPNRVFNDLLTSLQGETGQLLHYPEAINVLEREGFLAPTGEASGEGKTMEEVLNVLVQVLQEIRGTMVDN